MGGGGGGALGGRCGGTGGSFGDGASGGDAGCGGTLGKGGGGEGEGGVEGGEGGGEGKPCMVTLVSGPRKARVSVTRSVSGSGGCIETRMMTGTRSVVSRRRQQWHTRFPSPGVALRLRERSIRGASSDPTTATAVAHVRAGCAVACCCLSLSHCAKGTSAVAFIGDERRVPQGRRARALTIVGHPGATNKVARRTRVQSRMGHVNATPSTFFPEVQAHDNSNELANQALAVFLGISFLAIVCVLLSYTVISSTLIEFDVWSRRKHLADMELAEVAEFPRLDLEGKPRDDELHI